MNIVLFIGGLALVGCIEWLMLRRNCEEILDEISTYGRIISNLEFEIAALRQELHDLKSNTPY
jgi:hypothetical protein